MSELLKKIELDTQRLSKQERAFLAERLLKSGQDQDDIDFLRSVID